MEFVAKKDNWLKYADTIKDYSLIHRDDAAAKKSGLEGICAPGMWLASHVQGNSKIGIAEFIFKNLVYDGDLIRMEDYSFYNREDLVCRSNIILGEPTNENISLPKGIVYFQEFHVSEKNIRDFLDSIKFNGMNSNPEMYLMSLSVPTLLNYSKPKGLVGIHAYQSMEVCKPFNLDHVRVNVEEEKIGSRMCKLNLYWESNGEVVATGKSKVLPISI